MDASTLFKADQASSQGSFYHNNVDKRLNVTSQMHRKKSVWTWRE